MDSRAGVLILNVSGIGDFIDSVPALRFLRQQRAGQRITLAAAEKVAPLARRCPYVDEVVALPAARGRAFPSLVDLPRWLGRLAPLRRRFSTVVALYPVSSAFGALWVRGLLAWLVAEETVGPVSGGLGGFFKTAVEAPRPGEDALDGYLRIAGAAPDADRRLEVWVSDAALARTKDWLDSCPTRRVLDGPRVLVALGGDRATRHESPERAARWLGELQAKHKIRPILWGNPTDPGPPPGVECADARGRFDVEGAAALFRWSDAVITTHSAPQHLAGAWGLPAVVLVGPGDPVLYHPHLPADRARSLRRAVPCAPCYFDECPLPGSERQKCMTGIAPEDIVSAFEALLPAIRVRRS